MRAPHCLRQNRALGRPGSHASQSFRARPGGGSSNLRSQEDRTWAQAQAVPEAGDHRLSRRVCLSCWLWGQSGCGTTATGCVPAVQPGGDLRRRAVAWERPRHRCAPPCDLSFRLISRPPDTECATNRSRKSLPGSGRAVGIRTGWRPPNKHFPRPSKRPPLGNIQETPAGEAEENRTKTGVAASRHLVASEISPTHFSSRADARDG